MNPIEKFFREDIPAVFAAWRLRIERGQLNSRLSSLEKAYDQLITDLGTQTWNGRVQDPGYSETYAELDVLDASRSQVQQEIDSVQSTINLENDRLKTSIADFDVKLKDLQTLRGLVQKDLGRVQKAGKDIEEHIDRWQTTLSQGAARLQKIQAQVKQLEASTLPETQPKISALLDDITSIQSQLAEGPAKVDILRRQLGDNHAEQAPMKSRLDDLNLRIAALQEQSRVSLAQIQAQLKVLNQTLIRVTDKKAALLDQMSALMPELGRQSAQYRPKSDKLTPFYARLDTALAEMKSVRDDINLNNARIATASTGSFLKVVIVTGAFLLLLLCGTLFISVLVPQVAGRFKPSEKDIRLTQTYTLEGCSVMGGPGTDYIDVSVWQNRRDDYIARAGIETRLVDGDDLVLSYAQDRLIFGPSGSFMTMSVLDSGGSRVERVDRVITWTEFHESTAGPARVEASSTFTQAEDSQAMNLQLQLINQGDFALLPRESAYALVLDSQNRLLDIQVGSLLERAIDIDATGTVQFATANFFGEVTCLEDAFSDQEVTFWYFVPLQYRTRSDEIVTISGKVNFSPP